MDGSGRKDVLRSQSISAREAAQEQLLQARELHEQMGRWAVSGESTRLAEHEVEQEIERRSREVSRLVLQAHVSARGIGHVGSVLSIRGPSAEEVLQFRARAVHTRELTSIFGTIDVSRQAYMAAGHSSIHPLDWELELPARSFSYVLQSRLVDEVVRGPFDEAVESIRKQTEVQVPKRSVEQVVGEAAWDFDAFYMQRAVAAPEQSGPILVMAVDCKGVPMVKPEGAPQPTRRKKGEKANKKKMATVATVFTQQPYVRTPEEVVSSLFDHQKSKETPPRPEDKRVWASLTKEQAEVLEEVAREAASRDPQKEKTRVVVTDGERRLQKGIAHALPGTLLILDFIHVLGYLWKVGHAFYEEGSREAEQWVRQHALMILRGQVSQVVKGITQSATKRKLKGSKREAVDQAANYFYRNRKRMEYDRYLAAGLPIASGAVEGACKNLVKDRMERSGMRWQLNGAEAVLKLRAIHLSGDMEEYWNYHIKQDQLRLYGAQQRKQAA
jgi:hypothetical protein